MNQHLNPSYPAEMAPLTSSGSSTTTFRPGFARSGSTHSLLGLANTFPDEELVSFPGTRKAAFDAEGVAEGGGGLTVLVTGAGLADTVRDAVDLAATGFEVDADVVACEGRAWSRGVGLADGADGVATDMMIGDGIGDYRSGLPRV